MLTAKEIGKYIVSPDSIQAADLDELKNLSEKYPYTQLFSILYLKGMSASSSVDFETSLKEHSYRISDRGQLYKLIHDHDHKSEEQAIEPKEVELGEVETENLVPPIENTPLPETTEEIETIETVESPTPAEPEKEDIILDEEASIEDVQTPDSAHEAEVVVPSEESSHDTLVNEVEEEAADYGENSPAESEKQLGAHLQFEVETEIEEEIKEPEQPKDGLEESILHHVYANQYQLPELTEEEKAALEKKKREEIDPPRVPEEIVTIEEKELPVDSRQTFTNWLHANSNYSEPNDTEKKAINSLVDDFATFDPLESLSGEFEKPKKEFFSPSKKAKESLSENQLPVSETLAKIYVMQGNYPKAISAYNELILAFPEKKIFFANQIEDLKKKLNK